MCDAEVDLGETLTRLQAEICDLESAKTVILQQLASIDSSLSCLRAKYGTVKNRTALIGILPNEILARIFEVGRDLNIPGGDHFELVVSHVSHFWREVAIQSPSLWNILEIAPSVSSSQMLEMYVARAKVSHHPGFGPSLSLICKIYRHAVLRSGSISWRKYGFQTNLSGT